MDIYQEMKNAEIEIDHHESDLYVPCNQKTKAILNQYQYRENVIVYTNKQDGKLWYDIPFAYSPYWEKRKR
ncbi:MAG: hypothetical protein WC364_13255 [Eubacteriales bacterium]|jgi:hypothetical protein